MTSIRDALELIGPAGRTLLWILLSLSIPIIFLWFADPQFRIAMREHRRTLSRRKRRPPP